MLDSGPLRRTPATIHALDRWRKLSRMTTNQVQEHQLRGGHKPARLGIRLRGENADANHDLWPNERIGRSEFSPVKLERDLKVVGCKMRREREGKPEFRGQTGAEIARPEKVERDVQAGARNGHHRLAGRDR